MSDGRVAFAKDRIVIDEEFVEIAKQGRAPEKRFRFSSPCVEKGCNQWDGARCGVIEKLMNLPPTPETTLTDGTLPECSIREDCRWFGQRGAAACGVCPLVVTDGS